MTDVPLICDPVPGPPKLWFSIIDRALSEQDLAGVKALWEEACAGRSILLAQQDYRISWGLEDRQWPDAEFCAA